MISQRFRRFFLIPLTAVFWLFWSTPSYAHMGTMTKSVEGMVINLSSRPIPWESLDRSVREAKTAHLYYLSLTDAAGRPVTDARVSIRATRSTKPGSPGEYVVTDLTSTDRPGMYAGQLAFPSDGEWELQVTVERPTATTSVTFTDRVVSQPDSKVVLGFLALVGITVLVLRRLLKPTFNLLNLRPIKRLVGSRWYPGIFRWGGVVVLLLIFLSLLRGPVSTHLNPGWAITWLLWWPLVPLTIFLAGRIWCGVCPIATLGDWTQSLYSLRLRPPKWLQRYGIWIINGFFLALTWYDVVYGIVSSVRATGVVLLLVMAGAVVTGMLLERRAFCRFLCPLGGLWGNYALVSTVEIRGDNEKCRQCRTLECYRGDGRTPGCPMFLAVRNLDSSRYCNLCANCIKSCPHDAVKLNLRSPGYELQGYGHPRLDVAVLAAALVGIVLLQNAVMLERWQTLQAWLVSVTGWSPVVVLSLSVLAMTFLPVAILWLTALTAGGARSAGRLFAAFGLALVPLNLGTHVAHNLLHLLAEGKLLYWLGIDALTPAQEVVAGLELTANPGLMMLIDQPTVVALQNLIVLLGAIGSLYAGWQAALRYKPENRTPWKLFVPFAMILVTLLIVNFWILAQPMALRA